MFIFLFIYRYFKDVNEWLNIIFIMDKMLIENKDEDELSIFCVVLNKMIKEFILNICVVNDVCEFIFNCCIEFIYLVFFEVNEICNK